MPTPLFDLHAHFSFKPANSSNYRTGQFPDPDHWTERFKREKDFSKLTQILEKSVVKSSQLHGDAALEGGHRLIVNSFYPLERGFIVGAAKKQIATLTGHSLERISEAKDRKHSYFHFLEEEYLNLLRNQGKNAFSTKAGRYTLISSFEDWKKRDIEGGEQLFIVNSIEGAHSLADDFFDRIGRYIPILREEKRFIKKRGKREGDTNFERFVEALYTNLNKVKAQWSHPPFFIGLAHHYYNHICGHSPSLKGVVELLANQDGATVRSDGTPLNFYYVGIQRWGFKLLAQMLKRSDLQGNPARRILVDTKHMSPQARLDYHSIVKSRKEHYNDAIPIVVSHSSVNGRKSMERSIKANFELLADEKSVSACFNPGVINLFDDEIVDIIASDGLIGIMLDERRIVGKKLPPEAGMTIKRFEKLGKETRHCIAAIESLRHELKWKNALVENHPELVKWRKTLKETIAVLKPVYMALVFRQIFHIVEVAGPTAWNHIALGTDYEGVINPLDIYLKSSDMNSIREDLLQCWKTYAGSDQSDQTRQLYSSTPNGLTREELIDRFAWKNGMNFLKKYYTEDYLVKGINPKKGWIWDEEGLPPLA